MSGIELGGALRELSRIDRLLLADIAGAHRLQHEVAQRHRRAHQGEKPIHRCRRIGRIYSGDARSVGKLVDERRCILAHIRAHEGALLSFRSAPGTLNWCGLCQMSNWSLVSPDERAAG